MTKAFTKARRDLSLRQALAMKPDCFSDLAHG
jgi:hypothetical protein